MKLILAEGNKFVLRFDRGEEVMGGLKQFCTQNNVRAGCFSGIGAAQEATIAFYEFSHKRYHKENLREDLEITNLSGNVAVLENDIVIHAHGSFGNYNLNVRGGHVMKLVVSATCEIVLEKFSAPLTRAANEEIGLNLLE